MTELKNYIYLFLGSELLHTEISNTDTPQGILSLISSNLHYLITSAYFITSHHRESQAHFSSRIHAQSEYSKYTQRVSTTAKQTIENFLKLNNIYLSTPR